MDLKQKKRLIIIVVVGVLLIFGAYIFMEWFKWQVELSWMEPVIGLRLPG